MNHLLKQINDIQKILQDYRVEGAYIFGSRLFGSNNEFSDLDIVIYLRTAVKGIKKNDSVMRELYSMGMTAEQYVNLLMNPAVLKIKNTAKLDANIIGEYEPEQLNGNVYKNKVAIIENYNIVDLHIVEEKIQEVRKCCKPYVKCEQDKDTIIIANLGHIAELPRYFNIIDCFEKFQNPIEKGYLCAMRNEMIKEVCLFSLLVDKVDKESFEDWHIDYNQLSILNDIIKKKKLVTGNYNTSALSWIDCPKSIFSLEELTQFWMFIENHIKMAICLLQISDPSCITARRKYQKSISDHEGFLKTYEKEYNENISKSAFLEEYLYGVEYFMALKGEKKKFHLTEDMKRVFINEIPFPQSFNCYHLFNGNRSKNAIHEKMLLETACSNNFVDVICFELKEDFNKYKDIYERERSIYHLKEYSKEDINTLEALNYFILALKEIGMEVILRKDNDNRIVRYARAYLPEWNMIINPTTQNVESFIESLCSEGSIVCIVDIDYTCSIKAYLVKAKKPFIESYRNFKEQRDKETLKMMERFQKSFMQMFNENE